MSKTLRLPGMPAPGPELIAAKERVDNALRDLHAALRPTLDAMRLHTNAALTFNHAIQGDVIHISIKPAEEKE